MPEKVLKELLLKTKIHNNGTATIPKIAREALGLCVGDTAYLEIPVDQEKARERYNAQQRKVD
jgi:bifunctional DNA-binding transcriptional regulator/antitoxin component of YhaV-PrlF toxin-antitoxin module